MQIKMKQRLGTSSAQSGSWGLSTCSIGQARSFKIDHLQWLTTVGCFTMAKVCRMFSNSCQVLVNLIPLPKIENVKKKQSANIHKATKHDKIPSKMGLHPPRPSYVTGWSGPARPPGQPPYWNGGGEQPWPETSVFCSKLCRKKAHGS